jgi:hypothetical protein
MAVDDPNLWSLDVLWNISLINKTSVGNS